jgi:hypothetical protein
MIYDRCHALAGELVWITESVEPADLREAFANHLREFVAEVERAAVNERVEGID